MKQTNTAVARLVLLCAIVLSILLETSVAGTARQQRPARRGAATATQSGRSPECGSAFDYQVLLDRAGFSPGEIDEQLGPNTSLALKAFQQSNNLPATGAPDCATWQALRSRDPSETVSAYTVTPEDVAGPFVPAIPDDMMEQANLPALSYTSPLEELGERFHVDPDLLSSLNVGLQLQPGTQLRVPNVRPEIAALAGSSPQIASRSVAIEVSRESSSLTLRDASGRILFFAPATVGSEHDPLPVGNWKVRGVGWNPTFHYNPDLFWDANPAHAKATIPPGPNNPVGIVWIDVNIPHYGIHGTPDPARIGHSYSHGCVRLTNWDAERVARAVRPGTVVRFR